MQINEIVDQSESLRAGLISLVLSWHYVQKNGAQIYRVGYDGRDVFYAFNYKDLFKCFDRVEDAVDHYLELSEVQ